MSYSVEQVQAFCQKYYKLSGSIKTLMGEEDYNFLLKVSDGSNYLVKISRPGALKSFIDYQIAIVEHLATSGFPLAISKILKDAQGQAAVELEGKTFLRIHHWVPGRMLDDANPKLNPLLKDWGKTSGLLTKHLQGFDHEEAHRFYKWNPTETLHSKKYLEYFQSEDEKKIGTFYWNLFETKVLPKLKDLRHSVCYNDAHEHNLLINKDYASPKVTGVIDFGDALYTATICELAITCAYAGMRQPDPIEAMVAVVQGYHEIFSLEAKEIELLFPMIVARLMITVSSAAWNKHKEPENEYLLISEKPAWDLLKKLYNISPNFIHFRFRAACGFSPCPKQSQFENWLNKNGTDLCPIIEFGDQKIIPLDLSVGSAALGEQANFISTLKFDQRINELLSAKDAVFGIGGYLEPRPFYTTEAYQVEGNQGAQWRTFHLGVDVWTKAGTSIYAPIDGVVESIQNNGADRDYGPTLILKHKLPEGENFYTLYGHLDAEVLEGLREGEKISAGDQIARIGAPQINGNWPPHLHFQIMLDLLNYQGDFPGAAFPNEIETWSSICPNPILSEGKGFFPFFNTPYKLLDNQEILVKRKEGLGKSLSVSYEQPLHIVRGYKQWLYEADGRRYLDTVNNVAHVGHQHPKVIAAAKDQINVLNTNTRYLNQKIIDFSEELLSTFPDELCVVHFVNSGSEANELAMRMVEAYNGQKSMIAVEVGYHGNTNRTIAVSSYKFDGKGGKGKPKNTHIVPIPDTYRGIHQTGDHLGAEYAQYVQKTIEEIKATGEKIGGFIAESILSCGGQIVLPDDYLKTVYEYVHAVDGLCIADEVQVGFGRVGEKFWGFELQGVIPDIVTLGKPIGNGHPLAAVVCTRKVADAFANGMEFFNTFGGNPVSCAIGKAVLEVLEEEDLQSNALEVGNYLKSQLDLLKSEFPIIGDVRGHGLFLGIELISDLENKVPAASQCSYLANRMRERGILMSTDGPDHNILKIKPPMCFNQSNADYLLSNLRIVLAEDFMQVGK